MFSPLLRLIFLPLSFLSLAACGQATQADDKSALENPADLVNRGALVSSTCSGCHSDQAGAIASLTDYTETMLIQSMNDYKSKTNGTTVMHRLARGYSEEDIVAISAYLGAKEAGE